MSLSSESNRDAGIERAETGRAAGDPAEERRGGRDEDASLAGDLDEMQRARPERAFNVGVTFGVLVTVAAAVFVAQNSSSTTFDWLWWDFRIPLWTALVGGVAVGVIMTLTALALHHRRQRRIERREAAGERVRRQLFRNRKARPVAT